MCQQDRVCTQWCHRSRRLPCHNRTGYTQFRWRWIFHLRRSFRRESSDSDRCQRNLGSMTRTPQHQCQNMSQLGSTHSRYSGQNLHPLFQKGTLRRPWNQVRGRSLQLRTAHKLSQRHSLSQPCHLGTAHIPSTPSPQRYPLGTLHTVSMSRCPYPLDRQDSDRKL
eukprot:SAG31_NODE_12240_length_956_cov_1.316219_2_plen_166_part_00